MNQSFTYDASDDVLSPVDVDVWERDDFIARAWDYKPGEHVTIIGPTGRGKTTLGLDLLKATAKPELKAYVLMSKPRDETIGRYAEQRAFFGMLTKQRGFKVIEDFPPDLGYRNKKTRGFILKPYQSLTNFEADDERMTRVFRRCMRELYASKQPNIVFADEVQELQIDLGLKKECIRYWKRGRSMDSGFWACAQRSAYNAQDMYNAAAHLFLFNDPDKKNRERFAQIGGVNPDLVEDITGQLSDHQALYIRRSGSALCIVNP